MMMMMMMVKRQTETELLCNTDQHDLSLQRKAGRFELTTSTSFCFYLPPFPSLLLFPFTLLRPSSFNFFHFLHIYFAFFTSPYLHISYCSSAFFSFPFLSFPFLSSSPLFFLSASWRPHVVTLFVSENNS